MSAFSTFLITNIEQLHCRAAFSKHLFFRTPSTFQLLLLGWHILINQKVQISLIFTFLPQKPMTPCKAQVEQN